MHELKIGLLGCGTVGKGVVNILIQNQTLIQSRTGIQLILKYVADIDAEAGREIPLDEGVFITDAFKVVDDPEIDVVVELIGGKTIAKDLILRAVDNGKHVVTANKALIADHGNEMFKKALEKGVDIAYEASVGGCMPIIKTLRESLVGNRIKSMTGILNGTCNYILSNITDTGIPFEEALGKAQAIGFAEADPTLDVEGFDTAHKLAILSAIAYGMPLNLKDIYTEGITRITPMDIEFARQFGYRIKLLAISRNNGDSVDARVHPAMISDGNLLSNVNGSLNAVAVTGDAVEDIVLYGHGAGMMPTASAVISDLADIARNRLSGIKNRIPPLSFQPDHIQEVPIMPIDEISTNYYCRFSAVDSPGVLSKISGVLGNHDISIRTVHQKGRKTKGSVPLVMLTHLAKEADIQAALAEIDGIDVVNEKTIIIRIAEEDEQE